jgi:hypothetical protein
LFLVLDKVVCPFLAKYFDMPIWHPTSEKTLDGLLDAKVDLKVIYVPFTIIMCPFSTHSNPYCSSYSVKGTVVKKIFILNKNIVHLIDDMFWYMGFKTESQAEKVIVIIRFILFITIITPLTLIRIICIIARCVKILDLQITCGRTKGLLSPKQLMTWAISFVLPCAQAGFPTSVRPTWTTAPAAGPPVGQGPLVLPD